MSESPPSSTDNAPEPQQNNPTEEEQEANLSFDVIPVHIWLQILLNAFPDDAIRFRTLSRGVRNSYDFYEESLPLFQDTAVLILFDQCKSLIHFQPKDTRAPRRTKTIIIPPVCAHNQNPNNRRGQPPEICFQRTDKQNVFLCSGAEKEDLLPGLITKVLRRVAVFRVTMWNLEEPLMRQTAVEISDYLNGRSMPWLCVSVGNHGHENLHEDCDFCGVGLNPPQRRMRHHPPPAVLQLHQFFLQQGNPLPAGQQLNFHQQLQQLMAAPPLPQPGPPMPAPQPNQQQPLLQQFPVIGPGGQQGVLVLPPPAAPPIVINYDAIVDSIDALRFDIQRGSETISPNFFSRPTIRHLESLTLKGYISSSFDMNCFHKLTNVQNVEIMQWFTPTPLTPENINSIIFEWYTGLLPNLGTFAASITLSTNRDVDEQQMKRGMPFDGLYKEYLTSVDSSRTLHLTFERTEVRISVSNTSQLARRRALIPGLED